MSKPKEILQPGGCYHIFNHAVGDDKLFFEERNYPFFLEKINKWILPCSQLLSYCLMPNHFHLLVRIKEGKEIEELWNEKLDLKMTALLLANPEGVKNASGVRRELIERLVVEQFSHCFNSYVQAYNKVYQRIGALMKEGFQRKLIDSDDYMIRVICYIHNNPVAHGFVDRPEQWKYSSYKSLFSNLPSRVQREEVIELLGGKENLLFLHKKYLGIEV